MLKLVLASIVAALAFVAIGARTADTADAVGNVPTGACGQILKAEITSGAEVLSDVRELLECSSI